jgi:tRNA dimethylallyltransferase
MAAEIQVISIVGPTAVGKTELALELAELVDGEIVSLDAYQIYRGMDIGTAKASLHQRERVPHHLVDVLDIQELATVSDFSQWAATAIKQIHSKDKIAICVGGSGLYVQSVLEVLDIPPTDLDVRAKYEKLLLEVGEVELHKQLQAIDEQTSRQVYNLHIHSKNIYLFIKKQYKDIQILLMNAIFQNIKNQSFLILLIHFHSIAQEISRYLGDDKGWSGFCGLAGKP